MDPTVQVAIIGVITTIVTTAGVIAVAMLNSKRDRSGAGDANLTAILRERIVLRDEQIQDLKTDIAELRGQREFCLRNHAQEGGTQ